MRHTHIINVKAIAIMTRRGETSRDCNVPCCRVGCAGAPVLATRKQPLIGKDLPSLAVQSNMSGLSTLNKN